MMAALLNTHADRKDQMSSASEDGEVQMHFTLNDTLY